MKRVLVTGANGLVGQAACRTLLNDGHAVTALVRREGGRVEGTRGWCHDAQDFAGLDASWPVDLVIDSVVHLAARVHVMRDYSANPLAAFRATNVAGSLRVAEAAHRHGAKRLVYVSSIKAIGDGAPQPLREDDLTPVHDAYGRSKREAEVALIQFGRSTGMDVVIVRPPLVYGPGVRANFLQLMNAVASGIPLPLGSITARRSMVYVDNLAHALACCTTDDRASNNLFHVADGNDLTVAELVSTLGRHLKTPPRLFSIPPGVLRVAGWLTGRSAQVERLIDELRVDISHIRSVLGWKAPFTIDEGLAATAQWFLTQR